MLPDKIGDKFYYPGSPLQIESIVSICYLISITVVETDKHYDNLNNLSVTWGLVKMGVPACGHTDTFFYALFS